jgi:hypothetical protein
MMFPPHWRFITTGSGSTSRSQGPEADDIFFGIVRRGAAMIVPVQLEMEEAFSQ